MTGRKRHVRGACQTNRGVVTRQSLDHQHLAERVRTTATIAFRMRNAEKAQLSESLYNLAREDLVFVPFRGAGLDLFLGEIRDRPADGLLLIGEIKIHSATW